MKLERSLAKLALAVGAIPLLFFPGSVFSQSPFYQGKTITIIQATSPGGTADMMVKAALPYLKKHIPGEPTLLSEYMPGAGGNQGRQPHL